MAAASAERANNFSLGIGTRMKPNLPRHTLQPAPAAAETGSGAGVASFTPEPEQEHTRFEGQWVPWWRQQQQQQQLLRELDAEAASTGAQESEMSFREQQIAALSYSIEAVANGDAGVAGAAAGATQASFYDPELAQQLATASAWEQRVTRDLEQRLRDAEHGEGEEETMRAHGRERRRTGRAWVIYVNPRTATASTDSRRSPEHKA